MQNVQQAQTLRQLPPRCMPHMHHTANTTNSTLLQPPTTSTISSKQLISSTTVAMITVHTMPPTLNRLQHTTGHMRTHHSSRRSGCQRVVEAMCRGETCPCFRFLERLVSDMNGYGVIAV